METERLFSLVLYQELNFFLEFFCFDISQLFSALCGMLFFSRVCTKFGGTCGMYIQTNSREEETEIVQVLMWEMLGRIFTTITCPEVPQNNTHYFPARWRFTHTQKNHIVAFFATIGLQCPSPVCIYISILFTKQRSKGQNGCISKIIIQGEFERGCWEGYM